MTPSVESKGTGLISTTDFQTQARSHGFGRWVCGLILLFIASGCGGPSEPKRFPVSGVVIYDGKPVTTGVVTFVSGGGSRASGAIQPDGSYKLDSRSYGSGAFAGDAQVLIMATEERTVGSAPPKPKLSAEQQAIVDKYGDIPSGGPRKEIKWLVPMRYSDENESPLRTTVEEKENVINFNLP